MSMFGFFTPPKDPDDIRVYELDWGDDLAPGVTIVTAVWTVEAGDVEIDGSAINESVTTVTVSGGTLGTVQLVQCRVTLSNGEQFDRSRYIDMRQA